MTAQLPRQFRMTEQIIQFFRRKLHRSRRSFPRPREFALLETFEVYPKSVAVPFQYLQEITAPVTEHEQRFVKRIQLETHFDQQYEAVYPFPHVRGTAREIYLMSCERQHIPDNASHTSAKNALSKPGRTLAVYGPILISIAVPEA